MQTMLLRGIASLRVGRKVTTYDAMLPPEARVGPRRERRESDFDTILDNMNAECLKAEYACWFQSSTDDTLTAVNNSVELLCSNLPSNLTSLAILTQPTVTCKNNLDGLLNAHLVAVSFFCEDCTKEASFPNTALLGAISAMPLVRLYTFSGYRGHSWEPVINFAAASTVPIVSLGVFDCDFGPLDAGMFSASPALELLILHGCGITMLPEGVFDHLTELQALDLGNNSISAMPAAIFDKLSQLRSLNFEHNALTELPGAIFDGLLQLMIINAGNNHITSIPEGLFDNPPKPLVEMLFNENDLTSVPAGLFDQLPQVAELDLSHNRITSIPAGLFDTLTENMYVFLNGNQLRSLPLGVFDAMNLTRMLTLGANRIEILDDDIFAKTGQLGYLDISENLLEGDVIRLIIPCLETLTFFNASFNTRATVESAAWLILADMKTLDVSGTLALSESTDPDVARALCFATDILGLRKMESASAEQFINVIQFCLSIHVKTLDVSQNIALANLTLLQAVLEDFEIIIAVSHYDDSGNTEISVIQMKHSPAKCEFTLSTSPRNPYGWGRGDSDWVVELPVMVYDCQCSLGYFEASNGVCTLFWSGGRIASIAVGCIVFAVVLLAYFAIPWYRRRQRTFHNSLQLKELLLAEAGDELDQMKMAWQIQWRDVQLGDILGQGAFGIVKVPITL